MGRRDHFRLLQQKRYASRVFANPFFAPAKKRPWVKTLGRLAAIGLGAGLLLFLGNFLLRAPYYQIGDIQVSGNESIPTEQIKVTVEEYLASRVWFFGRPRNRFFFNAEDLKARLNTKFSFAWLSVRLLQDRSLIVQVEEKASQLLWRSGEQAFLVDLQGVAIRPLTAEELGWLTIPQSAAAGPQHALARLPVFRDLNSIQIQTGQVVLTAAEIDNIFLFHKLLLEQQIEFVETKIDRLAGKWMSVTTKEGYDILFDPSGNIQLQAENLEVVRRDLIKERKNLRYIDLRFGDHVYFK